MATVKTVEKPKSRLSLYIGIGTAVFILLILVVAFILYRRRKATSTDEGTGTTKASFALTDLSNSNYKSNLYLCSNYTINPSSTQPVAGGIIGSATCSNNYNTTTVTTFTEAANNAVNYLSKFSVYSKSFGSQTNLTKDGITSYTAIQYMHFVFRNGTSGITPSGFNTINMPFYAISAATFVSNSSIQSAYASGKLIVYIFYTGYNNGNDLFNRVFIWYSPTAGKTPSNTDSNYLRVTATSSDDVKTWINQNSSTKVDKDEGTGSNSVGHNTFVIVPW